MNSATLMTEPHNEMRWNMRPTLRRYSSATSSVKEGVPPLPPAVDFPTPLPPTVDLTPPFPPTLDLTPPLPPTLDLPPVLPPAVDLPPPVPTVDRRDVEGKISWKGRWGVMI